MGPPNGLVYQNELPFERDAVQCRDGKWYFVRLRHTPGIVTEADSKEAAMHMATKLSDRPFWEEHYEGMVLVDCIPPQGVFRHPQTCFLVTDGSKREATKIPEHPASHVRLKVRESEPPRTPRSASWPEERTSDWKLKIKKLVDKL